jgi:hypothetical protein
VNPYSKEVARLTEIILRVENVRAKHYGRRKYVTAPAARPINFNNPRESFR